jgi:hypothetical protein
MPAIILATEFYTEFLMLSYTVTFLVAKQHHNPHHVGKLF